MDVSTLGPGTWFLLHASALKLKYNDGSQPLTREQVLHLISIVRVTFPFRKCREHFSEYCSFVDPRTSPDLFRWTVDAHNRVNERNGKDVISYEQAESIYKQYL